MRGRHAGHRRSQAFGWSLGGTAWGAVLTTLLWGAVLLALLAGSMVKLVRRFVSRFGLPLVVLSLALAQLAVRGPAPRQGPGRLLDPPGRRHDGHVQRARPGDRHAGLVAAAGGRLRTPRQAQRGRPGQRLQRHLDRLCAGQHLVLRAGRDGRERGRARHRPGRRPAAGPRRPGGAGPDPDRRARQRLRRCLLGLGVGTHSLRPRWSVRRWGLLLAAVCIALRAGAADAHAGTFPAAAELGVRAALRRDPRPAGHRQRAGAWLGSAPHRLRPRRCIWIAWHRGRTTPAPSLGAAVRLGPADPGR